MLVRKRQRRQQQQQGNVLPNDGSKGMQEEENGRRGITEIQQLSGDRQVRSELHGQAMSSELDPSRGAFHEVGE